jgi:hypothetical protein
MMKPGRFARHLFQRLLSVARADGSHHLLRDEFIETLQQSDCALCVLARRKSQRYIETLFGTAVMDVEHRDAWRLAKGLCPVHAEMAIEIPQSSVSLAILYEDVLGHEIAALSRLATPERSRLAWLAGRRWGRVRNWLRAWQQRTSCPVCCLWQEQERLYIAVLLDDWYDAALTQAFSQSCGLCLPHIACLIAWGATHRHLSAVLAAQQKCFHALHDDLREFLRKQDYRFVHQPYGREADAWRRAVRLLSGTRHQYPGGR